VWPLLTVETDVNGDSKSTNERCPSLVGSLAVHYFNSFVPIAHQAGQVAVLGRRSFSMCVVPFTWSLCTVPGTSREVSSVKD
jgi:hypothetical protein